MFRKVLTASILGILLSGTLVSASSGAVKISNGTPCTKSGASTKVGSSIYKCAKNPVVNKTKLTWVSIDCITTNTGYAKLSTAYVALAKAMPTTLADLDAKIVAEGVKATAQLAKADAADAKIVEITAKLATITAARAKAVAGRDALIADTAHASANAASISAIGTSLLRIDTAIRLINSEIKNYTAASVSYRKVGKTVDTMKATRASAVLQLSQAKDGLAQSLTMRNLVCQKGM